MVLTFRPMDSVQCTTGCGCLDFHSQRFSSLLRNEACPFRNQQAVRWSDGDHSSIWDSWPIAFSGHPRGPRVVCETECPRHAAPNFSAETRSRTRVSREPNGHRQRKILRMERIRSETLKLFVVSDVGRRSTLLSSTQSTRWWQSFWLRSDAPSPAGCLWPARPRRTLGTGRAWSRR